MSKRTYMVAIYLIISVAVVALDQLLKWLLFGMSVSLVGDFLWIESSFNTGAAFSMLAGAQWLFIVVTIVACVIMIYFIFSKKFDLSKFSKISLSFILGGAIGNLIDRIFLGGVRDFIYFKSINFAIFNIADAFITVGAILLAISLIISLTKSKKGITTSNGTD